MNDSGQSSGRPLPRLAVLRAMTDRAVLDEVLTHRRITRAELATGTGISKPTISESVRRLEGAGLLRPSGSRTGRRGRVATFYELAPEAGYVLALEASQAGVHSVSADLAGDSFDERHRSAVRSGDTRALTAALREVVQDALHVGDARHGTVRGVALSVANPVDPATREIIALPDSPFPEGLVQPGEILADLLDVPLLVDNDVNWAALAEHRMGAGTEASSFAYVHIGAGIGMGLYIGDQLVRGAHGLAGELGYLNVPAAGGPAPLATALARQGFGRADAPSNDVAAILDTFTRAESGDRAASAAVRHMGTTIGRAIASVCTIVDPERILLGGPVGSHTALLEPVRTAVDGIAPLSVRIEPGHLGDAAPLNGALTSALEHGRSQLVPART